MHRSRHPRPWLSKMRRVPQRAPGFSLIEVLVGTAITVTVVSSLAAIALIAELRLGRDAEVNQSLTDHWTRTLIFINNEAQHAYWIRTSLSGSYPTSCDTAAPADPLLVLEGPPSPSKPSEPLWQVVYGVRPNNASTEWRGANRLVRCGPPFEAISRWAQAEADANKKDSLLEANAAYGALQKDVSPKETVIADQLAEKTPLQVQLFEPSTSKDRDALLSLFFARKSNPDATYPAREEFPGGRVTTTKTTGSGYQTQIRAARNPGFDPAATSCVTELAPDGINQEPKKPTECSMTVRSSDKLQTSYKEYRLPAKGSFVVNQCTLSSDCIGPKVIGSVEVIYLSESYASFAKQFSQSNSGPCSRTSCYLSGKEQKVQIYDGDILVFTDKIYRL